MRLDRRQARVEALGSMDVMIGMASKAESKRARMIETFRSEWREVAVSVLLEFRGLAFRGTFSVERSGDVSRRVLDDAFPRTVHFLVVRWTIRSLGRFDFSWYVGRLHSWCASQRSARTSTSECS